MRVLLLVLLADPRKATETLNWSLEAVLEGMQDNNMKISPDKVKELLVSGSYDLGVTVLHVQDGFSLP